MIHRYLKFLYNVLWQRPSAYSNKRRSKIVFIFFYSVGILFPMSNLVIVESPAKCSKIQGFLGTGWKVLATFGHIRALEEDLEAIGIDRGFEPKYIFMKEKAKSIYALKEAAKTATTIYLASDDDREGEAIAFSVALLLGLNPATTPRAVFHEITSAAVRQAVANPRFIDMNRVNAQQARSVLDLMVGFTISPLLWTYVGPALSAGRCQTPALRLLCEREKEIQSFQSAMVWKLRGSWTTNTRTPFHFPAILKDELEDKDSALNYLENIHNENEATVLTATTKPWSEYAPKPLITSTLQQEASALYSLPPKQTMQIAQKLYEAGHITYMRTDHAVLSEEAITQAKAQVQRLHGAQYISQTEKKSTNSEKPVQAQEAHGSVGKSQANRTGPPAAQEAHEAIRPTHFDVYELDNEWNAQEKKVYRLIWCRAVQSVMAPAKGDDRVVIFTAEGDPGEFPWEAKWRRTSFPGWKKVGLSTAVLDESEANAEEESVQATWIQALSIREGDKCKWLALEAAPHITKAPPRYNEATLVRELEKKGIGRPSTYASLVGTLLDKKYAEKKTTASKPVQIATFLLSALGQWPPKQENSTKQMGAEKDKMVPTPLGLSLLDFCLKEFKDLFEYGFTAQMETRLDRIAQGEEEWKNVCNDTWNSYKDHYLELKSKKKGSQGAAASSNKVKEFSDGLKAVLGKKGPVLLREENGAAKFFGWPEGTSFAAMTEEKAKEFIETTQTNTSSNWGTFQGQPIVVKKGPHGYYAQCGNMNVKVLDGDNEETIQAKFEEKSSSVLHKLGDFEFRNGQYGPYMFKKAAGNKKPIFVNLPSGLDPKTLTVEAAEQIYQTGMQQKSASTRGGRGRGSGFRGRGGRGQNRGK